MTFHATTIVAVKKDGKVAVAGDGQVTFGERAIMKANARKVRRLYHGKILLKNSRSSWSRTAATSNALPWSWQKTGVQTKYCANWRHFSSLRTRTVSS